MPETVRRVLFWMPRILVSRPLLLLGILFLASWQARARTQAVPQTQD